ncbi:putative glucan 1,3-beta-glucosidase D [Venturia inaequalis]|nr:putative glucan 1,3-beta-glucosidase D [Venturia inaequalis]
MSQPHHHPHPARNPTLTHQDIKTHNLHILETRLRAQQDKLQVTELMVQGIEHRISVVKDQTTRLSSGARDRGVMGREDAPVKRLIHPVLPTFGLRVKQLGGGSASIGPRAV